MWIKTAFLFYSDLPRLNRSFNVGRSLYAIGKGCSKLKNLKLTDCYSLSDKGLEAVAVGCTELTNLEINGCHNIGTFGLETIGRSCK